MWNSSKKAKYTKHLGFAWKCARSASMKGASYDRQQPQHRPMYHRFANKNVTNGRIIIIFVKINISADEYCVTFDRIHIFLSFTDLGRKTQSSADFFYVQTKLKYFLLAPNSKMDRSRNSQSQRLRCNLTKKRKEKWKERQRERKNGKKEKANYISKENYSNAHINPRSIFFRARQSHAPRHFSPIKTTEQRFAKFGRFYEILLEMNK